MGDIDCNCDCNCDCDCDCDCDCFKDCDCDDECCICACCTLACDCCNNDCCERNCKCDDEQCFETLMERMSLFCIFAVLFNYILMIVFLGIVELDGFMYFLIVVSFLVQFFQILIALVIIAQLDVEWAEKFVKSCKYYPSAICPLPPDQQKLIIIAYIVYCSINFGILFIMLVYLEVTSSSGTFLFVALFIPAVFVNVFLNTMFMSHANDHKITLTPERQRRINADPQISNQNQDSNQQMLGREYSIPNTLERADHLDPDHSNLDSEVDKQSQRSGDREQIGKIGIAFEGSRLKECNICLENLSSFERKIVRLRCHENHKFHRDCIIKWLERNKFCPICRKSVLTGSSSLEQDEEERHDNRRPFDVERYLIPIDSFSHFKHLEPDQDKQIESDLELC